MALHPIKKEVMGIEVSLDPRITTDMRLLNILMKLMKVDQARERAQKKNPSKVNDLTIEAMGILEEVADVLFGSKQASKSYQDKLAEKNDGFLDFQQWLTFVFETVDAFQKN